MAITLQTSTVSGTTLSTSNPHSFTHINAGQPRGVVVVIATDIGVTADDVVSGVTYGGVAMTRVLSVGTTAGDEDGRVYAYFLSGADAPANTQTVSVSKTGAIGSWVTVYGFDARENMIVHSSDSSVTPNPSPIVLTDSLNRQAVGISVIYSGTVSPPSIGNDAAGNPTMLVLSNIDVGSQGAAAAITNGTHGDIDMVWTNASDDVAWAAIRVGEPSVGQVARPDSTIQGLRTLSGATRHGALSDLDDTTYITGASGTDDILSLSNVGDPGGNTGYSIWVRGTGTTGTGTGTVNLFQGNPNVSGFLIRSQSGMPNTFEHTELEVVLTTTEADSITDFNDLYVSYSKSAGTSSKTIYEIWLEVPSTPTRMVNYGARWK